MKKVHLISAATLLAVTFVCGATKATAQKANDEPVAAITAAISQ